MTVRRYTDASETGRVIETSIRVHRAVFAGIDTITPFPDRTWTRWR
jgi:hypothetical protein